MQRSSEPQHIGELTPYVLLDEFLGMLEIHEVSRLTQEGKEIPEQKVRVLRTFGPHGLLDSFIWKEHDRHSAGQVLWGR